jgi:hypothetical protein
LFLVLVLFSAAVVAPADAHHSFAAYYYESETMTVEGAVVLFEFKNPHAWVHIAVKDATGQTLTYSAEWANPNSLKRQNITKETLKAGDYVIVTGSPGRNASEHKLHLKGIERSSDGWRWRGGRR